MSLANDALDAPTARSAELDRLEARLTADESAEGQAELHRRAAQLLIGLGDGPAIERAIEHLHAAWRDDAHDPDDAATLVYCLERAGANDGIGPVYLLGVQRAVEPAERVDWLVKAVRQLRSQGGSSADLEQLRAALATGTTSHWLARVRPGLARQLVEDFAQLGAEDLSAALLDALVAERHDAGAFADALRLGQLYERQDNPRLAHDAYRRALSIRPAAAEALAPVRRHLLAEGRFEQLAQFLAVSAAAAPSAPERADLWRELAQIAETQLKEPLRAAEARRRAWDIDGRAADAEAIGRLYAAVSRWDRVAELLWRSAVRTTNPTRKRVILGELATVQVERLADPEGALSSLALALQLDSADVQLRRRRIDLLHEKGDRRKALRELRALARRCHDRGERDALLRHYLAGALEEGLSPAGLVASLGTLDSADARNKRLLDQAWERSWQAGWKAGTRAQLLFLRWRWRTRDLRSGEERIVRGLACAQECEELGDPTVARSLLQRLAQDAPADPRLQQRLRGLPGATADPQASGQGDTPTPVSVGSVRELILRAQSQLTTEGSQSRAAAVRLLDEATVSCSIDGPDSDLLVAVLRGSRLFDRLAALLERCRAEASVAARRRWACWELASLYQDELPRPAHAVVALEQLLPFDALDGSSYWALDCLYAQLGRPDGSARLLEQWSAAVRGQQRVVLLERLARIYAVQLESPERELSCYQRILAQSPAHEAALAYCRSREERLGNTAAVAELLADAADAVPDPARREALLTELATVASQRTADLSLATLAWRKLSLLAAEQRAPREQLRACLRRAGKWRDLAEELRVEVARSCDPAQQVQLCLELAELSSARLDDRQAAVLYLRQARRLDPNNIEALVRLEAVYERLGRWRELVAVLQHHVELEQAPEQKVRLLHRAVNVLQLHLQRDEEALAVCRQAREILPADMTTAGLMSEIYAKRGQWQQLATLLRDRISFAREDGELSRLHSELAVLLFERLDDALGAAKQFERAMQYDASNAAVMTQLRRLYATLGRWDLLIHALLEWAGREENPSADRAAALCEVGRLYEEQLDDLDGAQRAYREAIDLDPDYGPALTSLRALAIARGEWRDAAALMDRALELIEDPVERARLLVENATILRDHLDQPAAALEAIERAMELDPDNMQAAQWLAGSSFARQDWGRAKDLLQRVVEGDVEPNDLHEYHYRLAVACEREGQADEAFAYYVKSFNREPMFLPTLNRLVDLCYQRRQWENAARIGEALIDHYGDEKSAEELADLHVRVGLCELHVAQREAGVKRLRELMQRMGGGAFTSAKALGDAADCWSATALEPDLLAAVELPAITKAVRQMERALRRVPEHSRALQVLAALTMSRGDWDRSLRYLDRSIEADTGSRAGHARLLLCAAEISAKKLLSMQRAEAYCERARQCQPDASFVQRRVAALSQPGGARRSADTAQTTIDISGAATQVKELEWQERTLQRGAAVPGERSNPSPPATKRPGKRRNK